MSLLLSANWEQPEQKNTGNNEPKDLLNVAFDDLDTDHKRWLPSDGVSSEEGIENVIKEMKE
jgi:hypothetical protein